MNTVSGLFDSYSNAQWALEVLEIYGVVGEQISIISRGTDSTSPPLAGGTGFVALGFTPVDAEFYAAGVNRGDILISVAAGSEEEHRICAILRGAGGSMKMNTYRQTYQDAGVQV